MSWFASVWDFCKILKLCGVHKRHEKSTEYAFEPRKQAGLVRTPWNELSEYAFDLQECISDLIFLLLWTIGTNLIKFIVWQFFNFSSPSKEITSAVCSPISFSEINTYLIFLACLSKISQISDFFLLLSKTSDESLCSELYTL